MSDSNGDGPSSASYGFGSVPFSNGGSMFQSMPPSTTAGNGGLRNRLNLDAPSFHRPDEAMSSGPFGGGARGQAYTPYMTPVMTPGSNNGGAAGGNFMQNAPPPFLPVRKPKQKVLYTHCVFCQNNGEDESYYMSHTVKDDLGQVTCPVLSHYICPICSATGPVAHTIKYCPQNKDDHYHENFASITQLKKMNSSIGKPRMSMHYQEPEPFMMAGRRPMAPRGMMLGCYDYPNGGPGYNNGGGPGGANNGFRRTMWHEPPSRRQPMLSSRLCDDFPNLTISSPTGGSDGFGGGDSSKDTSPLLTPPNTPWGRLPAQGMARPLLGGGGGMMGQQRMTRPPTDPAEFKWLDDLFDSNRQQSNQPQQTTPNPASIDLAPGKMVEISQNKRE